MRRPHSKQAFTLGELLVVIAIISILTSLLFPTISRSLDSARSAACATNLRQIGAACFSYATDNDGNLPPANIAGVNWPNCTYMYLLNPYLGSQRTTTFDQQKIVCFAGVFRCPGKQDWNLSLKSDLYHVSYGLNTFDPTNVPSVGPKLVSIKDPQKTVLVADLQTGYWALRNAAYMYRDFQALRHINKTMDNILFCDGHVESMPKNSFSFALTLP